MLSEGTDNICTADKDCRTPIRRACCRSRTTSQQVARRTGAGKEQHAKEAGRPQRRPASSHNSPRDRIRPPETTSSRTIAMNISPRLADRQIGFLATGPVPNWSILSRADEVDIVAHGRIVTSGRIDMLAMDGSVLWLQQDEGKGRALFLQSDGARVYRRPRGSKNRNQELINKG